MADHCEICGGELSPDDHHTSSFRAGYAHDDCIALEQADQPDVGIPDLLAGLEVGSISELKALVDAARQKHVYVVLVPPDVSDEPVRWCFVYESDAEAFARAHGAGAHVSFEPVSENLSDPSLIDYAAGCGISPEELAE